MENIDWWEKELVEGGGGEGIIGFLELFSKFVILKDICKYIRKIKYYYFLNNVIEYYKFMIIINVKFINYVIKVIWVSFKYFLLEYVLILEFII